VKPQKEENPPRKKNDNIKMRHTSKLSIGVSRSSKSNNGSNNKLS
jgi:hypothetical protein